MPANLVPFLRPNLDVLFVGLNPPAQSNEHKHYFSGKQSRFFDLLIKSGLIISPVDKGIADTLVFGGIDLNYHLANFGVVDLNTDFVETRGAKVPVKKAHLDQLIEHIRTYQPRIVCVIHSKVRDAFNQSSRSDLIGHLEYGACGAIIRDCPSIFFLNYFPNGNAIPDKEKIRIFQEIKDLL